MNQLNKILLILFMPLSIFAHTLLVNVIDNEDGTITVVGEFSTGESASGALLKLQALKSKKILFQKRLDEESELTVKIPKVAYEVILDGGPGHKATKEGIPPIGGFIKEKVQTNAKKITKTNNVNVKAENPEQTYKILFFIAFIFFLSTIFISIYNTNKILKKLKPKH